MGLLLERLRLLLVLLGELSFPRKGWSCLGPRAVLNAIGLGCHCEAGRSGIEF
jgi:hypothetical protein